jgi:hypothetical protein
VRSAARRSIRFVTRMPPSIDGSNSKRTGSGASRHRSDLALDVARCVLQARGPLRLRRCRRPTSKVRATGRPLSAPAWRSRSRGAGPTIRTGPHSMRARAMRSELLDANALPAIRIPRFRSPAGPRRLLLESVDDLLVRLGVTRLVETNATPPRTVPRVEVADFGRGDGVLPRKRSSTLWTTWRLSFSE